MPRLPLARTYRPQRFADVLGQQVPVRALGAAAARGDVASAYIFSGTRGIGKTTIARIFAKTLNCAEGPAVDCCDRCTPCREIAEGRALDVLELDAATHTGIDDIRELRDAAQYPPGRDRYRVFILDEAHQLSTQAWNGLLKILEEPPAWCVFLFCTTEPHKIPQTIESRSLHFSFRSPTPRQIHEHLAKIAAEEGIEIDGDALDLLVQAADGSVRDGLSALDQVRALVAGPITRETVRSALGLVPGEAVRRFVDALGAGDAGAALGIVAELDAEGQDLRAFTAEALERVRRLAVVRSAGPDVFPDGAALAEAARGFSIEQLVWLGKVLDETEARLRGGGAQRALLDLAAVRMSRLAGLTGLAELVDRLGSGPGPGGAPGGGGFGGGPAGPRGPAPGPRPAAPPAPRFGGGGPAPRRMGPPEPGDVPPEAPRAAAAPVEAAVAVAPAPRPVAGGLVAGLLSALEEARPALAMTLRSATGAEVSADGTLRLMLPPARAALASGQLSRPGAQQLLFEIAGQLCGRPVTQLEVGSGGGSGAPAAAAPRNGRREAIDRARKDPFVRALIDRFNGVFIDGQLLEADPVATEEN